MKKTLAAIIALLGITVLTACGSEQPAATTAAATTAAPAAAAEAPAAAAETKAEAPAETKAAAAADSDLAYILDKGTLIIGITEYDPANYYDQTGKLVGFDTEFAEALCDKLGIKPEFIVIDWDSKEIELLSKSIDCIWNMLSVSEDRKSAMLFSNSYLANHQVIVVKKDRLADLSKIEALNSADLTSVAEEGSAGEESALADVPDTNYIPVLSQADALLEVMSGTADMAVVDYTTAKSMCGEGTNYADLVMVPDLTLTDEVDAIGLRIGSDAVDKFNEIMQELYDDGTLAQMAEKYGLTDLLEIAPVY